MRALLVILAAVTLLGLGCGSPDKPEDKSMGVAPEGAGVVRHDEGGVYLEQALVNGGPVAACEVSAEIIWEGQPYIGTTGMLLPNERRKVKIYCPTLWPKDPLPKVDCFAHPCP
jgi:hypothetical protein